MEKWYKIGYTEEPIPKEKLDEWASGKEVLPGLHIPEPNPFIPTDFSRHKPDDVDIRPVPFEIKKPQYKLWYSSLLFSHFFQ